MRKLFLLIVLLLTIYGTQAQDKIKVACVGNSITFGAGVKDRAHDSYPMKLKQFLGADYDVRAFGESGSTLLSKGHKPYIKQDVYQQALDFAADIVLIHLGVNDTDPRNWPNYGDEFVRDYMNLMEAFKMANPKARIIIAEITPIADRHRRFISGTYDWQVQIRQIIKNIAEYAGVELVDFYSPLHIHPSTLPDAIHPNEEGAEIMAKTAYQLITGYYGGLKMPMLYGDNMMLQYGRPLTISGTANAGERIELSIASKKYKAVTNYKGEWNITIRPLEAGKVYTLSIESPLRKLEYFNVIAGDIWVCSGQSNMEWILSKTLDAKTDIPQANNDNIRVYNMQLALPGGPVAWTDEQLRKVNDLDFYIPTTWQSVTPDNAGNISAIAYYFAQKIEAETNIPVGLIINAVGGSNIEAWVDRDMLENKMPAILSNWRNNDFIQPWVRNRANKHLENASSPFQRHYYEPSYLYTVGIDPLAKIPIKGILWYQGESNAHNIEAHSTLFHLLVESWRKNWDNDTLPFYFVQLSSLNRPSWPGFRDSQRLLAEEIPYTAMAVTSDIGDSLDVHPRNKKDVGDRLARIALNKVYGKNIVASGPSYKSAEIKGSSVYLMFDNAQGLKTSDGKAPITFEVAELDGLYYPARATIIGNKIKLDCKGVSNPRFVRYGWQAFTRANLVNSDGLPVSTFKEKIK